MPHQIETAVIETLVEDPRNARAHDRRNLDAIKGSLERFGQVEPLVVRAENSTVIGGNGRLTAMKEMGWNETRVVRLSGLSDEEASALSLALNRTAELASWDGAVLSEILQTMPDCGESLAGLGFELGELRMLTGDGVDLGEFAKPAELDTMGEKAPPTRAAPNRSWFYVEYYDDEEQYTKFLSDFVEVGAMKPNTQHELTAEAFREMAEVWLEAKRNLASSS